MSKQLTKQQSRAYCFTNEAVAEVALFVDRVIMSRLVCYSLVMLACTALILGRARSVSDPNSNPEDEVFRMLGCVSGFDLDARADCL